MIDLPQDFRDLLVELHDAGAAFVVLGGHAVAFHGHPRATKDLDVLVRADSANASLVYRALAAFGAPLDTIDVQESDFATYDGVLQIGLPPRRIDVLNRASGITFEEAVAAGDSFPLDGQASRGEAARSRRREGARGDCQSRAVARSVRAERLQSERRKITNEPR